MDYIVHMEWEILTLLHYLSQSLWMDTRSKCMSLILVFRHPNILPLLCSFVEGEFLYIVFPYMAVRLTPGTVSELVSHPMHILLV